MWDWHFYIKYFLIKYIKIIFKIINKELFIKLIKDELELLRGDYVAFEIEKCPTILMMILQNSGKTKTAEKI